MKKALTRLTLAALVAALCAQAAAAQGAAGGAWVRVSPAGEDFSALMPAPPVAAAQIVKAGGLNVSGRSYRAAGEGRATFVVWSLKDTGGARRVAGPEVEAAEGVGAESLYLDRIAELAWELVVKPEVERLRNVNPPEEQEDGPQMAYGNRFDLGGRTARAYFVSLGKTSGAVYVWADEPRIYVVAALAADAESPQLKQFTDSFALKNMEGPGLPSPAGLIPGLPATIQVDPLLIKRDPSDAAGGRPPAIVRPELPPGNMGSGDAPAPNPDRPLRPTEVTRKALIIFKPEPGFTDEARKFNVTGVVRLRAILAADGQIKSLSVVKPLPHGLTRKALNAAKSIRFQPAQKDGQAVPQYVVLEYNFHIY